MITLPQLDESDRLRLARFDWIQANRGIMTRIARELGISVSVVSRVFSGKDISARVARRLAELNAPGFVNPEPQGGSTEPNE